jgi:hypothetical protein
MRPLAHGGGKFPPMAAPGPPKSVQACAGSGLDACRGSAQLPPLASSPGRRRSPPSETPAGRPWRSPTSSSGGPRGRALRGRAGRDGGRGWGQRAGGCKSRRAAGALTRARCTLACTRMRAGPAMPPPCIPARNRPSPPAPARSPRRAPLTVQRRERADAAVRPRRVGSRDLAHQHLGRARGRARGRRFRQRGQGGAAPFWGASRLSLIARSGHAVPQRAPLVRDARRRHRARGGGGFSARAPPAASSPARPPPAAETCWVC